MHGGGKEPKEEWLGAGEAREDGLTLGDYEEEGRRHRAEIYGDVMCKRVLLTELEAVHYVIKLRTLLFWLAN